MRVPELARSDVFIHATWTTRLVLAMWMARSDVPKNASYIYIKAKLVQKLNIKVGLLVSGIIKVFEVYGSNFILYIFT